MAKRIFLECPTCKSYSGHLRLSEPVWLAGGPPPLVFAWCAACDKQWLVYVDLPSGFVLIDMGEKPMGKPTSDYVAEELCEALTPQSLRKPRLN